MNLTNPSLLNIGELIQSGVVLRTREAVALVHEFCRQVDASSSRAGSFAAAAEDLSIGDDGELSIDQSKEGTLDPASAVATLLDILLPPPDDRPEYAVPSSLRRLPARLRASVAANGSANPKDLLAILRLHVTDDPRQLIRGLALRLGTDPQSTDQITSEGALLAVETDRVDRTTRTDSATQAPPPQEALQVPGIERAPWPPRIDQVRRAPDRTPQAPRIDQGDQRTLPDHPLQPAETEYAGRAVGTDYITAAVATDDDDRAAPPVVADSFRDERGGSAAESDRGVRDAPALGDDPDVFRLELPPLVDSAPRRGSIGAAWRAVAALALIAASGYAGYTFGRSSDRTHTQEASPTKIESTPADRPRETTGPLNSQPKQPRQPASASANAAPPRTTPARPSNGVSMAAPAAASDQTEGDAPHPLPLIVADGAFSPSFAPTGRQLLFHSGHTRTGRLLEADLDERGRPSHISPILPALAGDADARNYHPRLSPDARLIAFDSDRDGERGVYVSDTRGGHVRRVSGSGFSAVPSWSPDMKWLAFIRAETARPQVWNLWLQDLASGTLTRQTSFQVGQVWGASWFPDGRHLCYSHEDRLVVMDLASGTSDSFRTPRPGRLVRTPAVSPDGKRIVFQVFRDGVWLLDLPTGTMRRMLDDPTAEEFAWDPTGRRIAYHSRRDGTWRIWMTTPPSL